MTLIEANKDTVDKMNILAGKISYFFHVNFNNAASKNEVSLRNNVIFNEPHFLFHSEAGNDEDHLNEIAKEYYNVLCTKDGSYISPQEIVELVSNSYLDSSFEMLIERLPFLSESINPEKQRVKGIVISVLDRTLLKFKLEQEGFLKISTLQDFLMDYRNQRNTAYCDRGFFNNARKSFNDVPDNLQGYPSKHDINEFCKTAYLNHFKELNPFDSDADLSTEEFKCVFGDLTGFIQSQNEKEMINKSIQGSETPTRKRRL